MKLHTLIPVTSAIALSFGSSCDGGGGNFNEFKNQKADKQAKELCDQIEACAISYRAGPFSAGRVVECETYYTSLFGAFRIQSAECDLVVERYLDCVLNLPCGAIESGFDGFPGCESEQGELESCLLKTSEVESSLRTPALTQAIAYCELAADCSEYGYEDQYDERMSDAEIMRCALNARSYLAGLKTFSDFCYDAILRYGDCLFEYYSVICDDPSEYGYTELRDFECYATISAEYDRVNRECFAHSGDE